jgi:hypothetical protein
MKISDRFTDYGLVGGFFWTLQLAFVAVLGVQEENWSQLGRVMESTLARLPKETLSPLTAILGALALVAIFSTGLLLDLFGGFYFRAVEVQVFVRYLKRNQNWLERLLDQQKDYVQDDLSVLLGAPPLGSSLLIGLKTMAIWKKPNRQERSRLIKGNRTRRGAYTRIQSFLLSYVLLAPRTEKIELLNTQISLWSISRAISSAMTIVVVESTIALFKISAVSYKFFLVYAGQIGLTTGAILVVVAAYDRICSTLFALIYLIGSNSTQSASMQALRIE